MFLIALRMEWCKARARSLRWAEEVTLLLEEMRRVKEFFDWKARWWREQSSRRQVQDASVQDGFAAYCSRQAALFADLKASCEKKWRGVPDLVLAKQQDSEHLDGAGIASPICT